MSLLTIAQGLARDAGLAIPDIVATSNKREWREFMEIANAAGEELARRVDWGVLTDQTVFTGDGTETPHLIEDGFSRIVMGFGVVGSGGVVRPLTQAEWGTLTPTEGVPRYFLLRDDRLHLWPYLATSETVTVNWQSMYWCTNGTDRWMADDDESLIDEDLFLKCALVRWRRQKGMDYADYEAEYEASLEDFARFDDRARL